MRKMSENYLVLLCLSIMLIIGGLFLRQSLNENKDEISSSESSQKEKRSLEDNQSKHKNKKIIYTSRFESDKTLMILE